MRITLIIFSALLLSCGKEELTVEAPSMVGTWTHYSENDAWEIIYINADGTGKVEWFTNNKLHKETKTKTWYVKDNRLYLGKTTFSLNPYDITGYPVTSPSTEIISLDTLGQGQRYCILDDLHYVEKG